MLPLHADPQPIKQIKAGIKRLFLLDFLLVISQCTDLSDGNFIEGEL